VQPVLVGLPPQVIPVRVLGESETPGTGGGAALSQHTYYTTVRGRVIPTDGSLDRWINGEQIDPPWIPHLQGGETHDKHGRPTGQLPVDAVAVDTALGNRRATGFRRIAMPGVHDEWTGGPPNAEVAKIDFNREKPVGDQTRNVWVTSQVMHSGIVTGYTVEREETPNEAQARLAGRDTQDNSYHSGILNDRSNLSAVVAMDVAIGQAKTLDDPDWRKLLLAIADWRTNWGKAKPDLITLRGRLSSKAQRLVQATNNYYYNGIFPDDKLVPRTWPGLVKSQTKAQRAAGTNDPGVIA
ncbi:MAG: effector protein Tle3 domain-containing protein, partial [Rhodanobacter sp.]